MKITPETKPISEIYPIEGDIHYIIPDYQRNYSWETSNIDDLLNDVLNESPGYYIGNLLIESENSSTLNIVDGQQRLTTIALVLIAMFNRLNIFKQRNPSESDVEKIGSWKNDIRRKILYHESNLRLRLLQNDHVVFQALVNAILENKEIPYGNRLIVKRFNHIEYFIDSEIHDLDLWRNFYDKLNKIEILRISVSNVADAFSVFTSLNAKGMPLTLIDLLKSTYLGSAAKGGMDMKIASEKWNYFTSIFYDAEDEISSTAITQFLLNNFDTFKNTKLSSITKSIAIKEYRKLFEDNFKYINELIDRAKEFTVVSPLIQKHQSINLPKSIIRYFEMLQKLDSSQSYPIQMYLIYLFLSKSIGEKEVESSLKYLIKFFVRRNIILKPKSSSIRLSILSIVSEHKLNQTLSIFDVLKKTMDAISENNEVFSVALSESVYDVSVNTTKFILVSLERKHGTYFDPKQIPDNLDAYDATKGKKLIPKWTIEHILPKTGSLKNGWPEMISPDDPLSAKGVQDEHVHKIGNLTLSGYNPELSDKGFIEKRDYQIGEKYLGLRTKLFLNSSIPGEDELIESKDKWSIDDIKRRTRELGELTINLFDLDSDNFS